MKKIWILNHYAGAPSTFPILRHFNFAKYLIRKGYKVTIFASSAIHNSNINLINDDKLYLKKKEEGIPFVYIKTRQYNGNGKERIKNMFDYYRRLLIIIKKFESPDVIIGSSVHPLACLAAIKLSKKFHCKNIIEIRDLWPESLIEYNIIKPDTVFTKLLYKGEKWLYRKSEDLIFTMEGGKDYILEKSWSHTINMAKVHHINNGVDLEVFNYNKKHYQIKDLDLDNDAIFKVVYIGSIRKANSVGILVEAAKVLKKNGMHNIKILVYGDGNEKDELDQQCINEKINTIVFKGRVDKKYIPYVLSKCNLNLMHNGPMKLGKYGMSLNKSFDYLASQRPILSDIEFNYDYVAGNGAGITVPCDGKSIYNGILYFYEMDSVKYRKFCECAKQTALEYDFKVLTDKLIEIFEN